MTVSAGQIFLSEFIGTTAVLLMGVGVVASNLLVKSKARNGGWLMVTFGWGFAVFIGVYLAFKSGGHLNPAVTLATVASGAKEFVPGFSVTFAHTMIYLIAQLLGGIVGAVLAYLAFHEQYNQHEDQAEILGTFSTGPEVRSTLWNLVTEIIGTFVLAAWVLVSAQTESGLGPLGVALVVVAIGVSLGGPTGYAINPARDLGPRIAHQILPIKHKGSSDWGYAWIPVVGPIIGGLLAGVLFGSGALNIFSI